jgi:hypothetical protein
MAPRHGDTGICVLFVLFLLLCYYISGTVASLKYDRDTLLHIGELVGESNEIKSHFNSLFVDSDLSGIITSPSHTHSGTTPSA